MTNKGLIIRPEDRLLLQVHRSRAYGQSYFKPANRQAELVCELIQATVIRDKHVPIIKEMGFTIQVIPEVTTIEEL